MDRRAIDRDEAILYARGAYDGVAPFSLRRAFRSGVVVEKDEVFSGHELSAASLPAHCDSAIRPHAEAALFRGEVSHQSSSSSVALSVSSVTQVSRESSLN